MSKKKDWGIDSEKKYVFELTRPHGGEYIIGGTARIWCESTNSNRIIRLVDNDDTPFEDEQRADSIPTDKFLKFVKGRLEISGQEVNKILFLRKHDANVTKTKRSSSSSHYRFKWKEVNLEEVFEGNYKDTKTKHDLKGRILEASYEDLKDFLTSTYRYSPKTDKIEELVEVAFRKVEENPKVVNDNFQTAETRLKSKIIGLFKDGTLIHTQGIVTWNEGGLEVGNFKAKEENKLVDAMILWISKASKEAKDFEKKLATI